LDKCKHKALVATCCLISFFIVGCNQNTNSEWVFDEIKNFNSSNAYQLEGYNKVIRSDGEHFYSSLLIVRRDKKMIYSDIKEECPEGNVNEYIEYHVLENNEAYTIYKYNDQKVFYKNYDIDRTGLEDTIASEKVNISSNAYLKKEEEAELFDKKMIKATIADPSFERIFEQISFKDLYESAINTTLYHIEVKKAYENYYGIDEKIWVLWFDATSRKLERIEYDNTVETILIYTMYKAMMPDINFDEQIPISQEDVYDIKYGNECKDITVPKVYSVLNDS